MSRLLMCALALVLAVMAGCSDDEGSSTDVQTGDQSVGQETGPVPDTNKPGDVGGSDVGVSVDTGPAGDKGISDTVVGDQGQLLDYGANKPNSGAICTPPQNVCPNKQDACIIVAGGNQSKGMCLIKCTTKYAACPVGDPATQKSVCFLDYTGPPAEIYCAYMCKYETKTYSCPTGSICKVISTNTSVCVQQ